MRYILAILLLANSFVTVAQKLTVGNPAPKLMYKTWVQGKPIQNFEKGNIYVLDFWSTNCRGCVSVMPHLSMISQKLKNKVNFIGISVSEKDATLVAPFVAGLGKKITYSIAVDDGYMLNNFLRPLTNHLPTTVIIGKDGLIEWVGSAFDLENILPKIIDDKWDIDIFKKQLSSEEPLQDMKAKIGDNADWNAIKSDLLQKYHGLNADSIILSWQYSYYGSKGEIPKFCSSLVKYVEDFLPKSNPDLMNIYAWYIFTNSSDKEQLYTAAKWLETKAASIYPVALDTYANLLYKIGKKRKAIVSQRKALELIDQEEYVDDLALSYYKILTNEPTWKTLDGKQYYTSDNVLWEKVGKSIKQYSHRKADSIVLLTKIAYMKKAGKWHDLTNVVDEFCKIYGTHGNVLNVFAWDVFNANTNQIELNKALGWSEKSLLDGRYKRFHYSFYDTKANILHKLGRTKEAMIAEKRAIELCPEEEKGNLLATLAKIENGEKTWKE